MKRTIYYQICISLLLYFIVDIRLTTTNQVLLVLGVILWSVASIVGIILIVVKIITEKGRYNYYVNKL